MLNSSHSQVQSNRLKNLLQFISNAAIPLMIGVITLSIALHQQNVEQANRENDLAQAAELRKQDREQERLQRDEDQIITRLQRIDDKETARLQRELDLQIAHDKRIQDYYIAEQQRNLSEILRIKESQMARKIHEHNLLLADERRKENILFEYQNDLSTLLLNYESKSNQTRNSWWFVLQMKTGAASRQLDPIRRTILVETLLEAGLLDAKVANQEALLYTANLSGVQFSRPFFDKNDGYYQNLDTGLIIPRADLRFASFCNAFFSVAPVLAYSNLDYTDWSYSYLIDANFLDHMSMNEAKFYRSFIYGTHFDGYRSFEINYHRNIQMNRVSFEYNTECVHCFFRRVSLLNVRLNHSIFYSGIFWSLSMADGNLSNGTFVDTHFQSVDLDRADFSNARLRTCEFTTVSMIDCLMFGTIIQKIKFDNANLTGCQGLDLTDKQIWNQITFYNTILPNGTFIKKSVN